MRYKVKYNKYTIIGLLLAISIANITESYNFIRTVHIGDKIVSSTEILVYILCGLTTEGKTGLLDILRFSIPYILTLFITGIYITNILNDERKYFYIIRYGSYKNWIKEIFVKLIIMVIMIFSIYYIILVVISKFFIGEFAAINKAFYILYPYYDSSSSFLKLIILQFLLSVSIESLLVLIQLLLALFSRDTTKNFTYLSLIVILASFIGQYDCYNPLMLSKHVLLNTQLNINPLTTIISVVTIILIIRMLMVKIIKLSFRRNCI